MNGTTMARLTINAMMYSTIEMRIHGVVTDRLKRFSARLIGAETEDHHCQRREA